jgi:tRNA pseudouridine13 synthase
MAQYTIKQSPEDFVVKEAINLETADDGDYAYFWLTKTGHNTVHAIDRIADFVHIKTREIGFAGAKDRNAVTTQAISIKDPSKRIGPERFSAFSSDQIKLEYIGRGRKPISLGDLEANEFMITLRDCSAAPRKIELMINYFDDQRFSETNHDVGKAIVNKKFKDACSLIKDSIVGRHLEEKPNDYVGAMKELPLKIRMMHVHAYQSLLWNQAVDSHLRKTHKDVREIEYSIGKLAAPKDIKASDEKMPVIGFGMEPDAKFDPIVREIMKKESITERSFVIPSMPEISAEGGSREIVAAVKNLTIEDKSGEGEDKKTFLVKFKLGKGSYATMAVKQMMT